jgi:hypothetical protein
VLSNISPTIYIKETITLNTSGVNYGNGTYEIYSSSTTNIFERRKALLSNRNIDAITNDIGGNWQFGYYLQANGLYYLQSYIKNDFWVIGLY